MDVILGKIPFGVSSVFAPYRINAITKPNLNPNLKPNPIPNRNRNPNPNADPNPMCGAETEESHVLFRT